MAYTDNDGVRLVWESRGEGTPVLLIMGLGYTSEMWHRVAPVLATRFRVITFDNRGVGGSGKPTGPYPIATMAEDAAAVMRAAGIESAHVFGISMGGMIAQELALRHPEMVRSLILGCTACGGTEAVPAAGAVLRVLNARATMTPEEGVWAMVPFIYDASTPRERIEEDLAIRIRTFPAAASYLAQLGGIQAWGSYSRLGSIKAPTLIIHGENDQLIPPENAKILAGAIPGARLAMLASASHIFPTDQPERSIELILAFLESSAAARV
jgi:pimeloyl-ACP methyl ester carboxylesterase